MIVNIKMASGTTHFLVTFVLAFSLFAGGILPDLDHSKLLGGKHSIRELYDGFRGKSYTSDVRYDLNHIMHQKRTYNAIFLTTGIFLMFSIGLLLHLKLDNIF